MSRYHRAMRMFAGKLPFFSSCVGWPEELLPALNFLIDEGEELEKEEGRSELLAQTDADPESVPEWDWHIQYFRYGDDVRWYVHSAIEYVFAEPESVGRIQEMAVEADY